MTPVRGTSGIGFPGDRDVGRRRRTRPRCGGGRPGCGPGRGRARGRCRGSGRGRRDRVGRRSGSRASSPPRGRGRDAGRRSGPAPCGAWASSPSTSTSRVPVASRKSPVREARSSRPPSRITTWSLTRSSSPSRWEVTSTEMPKSWPIRCTRPSMSSRAAGSRPLVGSSSSTSLRVVGERLGELGALLHAGGVAAHRPVALLGEPDVAQHLRGPLAGRHPGQAGHHRRGARRSRWR